MNLPLKLNDRIFLIDDFDLNRKERTGTYVIIEDEITIVETSASPSIPYILAGLKQLKIDPSDIRYILLTHIHLDHAGGAGLLLEHCPNAKVVVHPKGARHLVDPSRLIAGAKMVYGSKFDQLFNPIIPIPEDKLIIKQDGETLKIGKNCTLTFIDTPGHANHHFSIFDPISNGIFTGDTIGIYYQELKNDGIELYLPSTSPNQFNPELMLESADKIEKLNVDAIYFGHYGMTTNVNEVFRQLKFWIPIFVEAAKDGFQVNGTQNDKIQATNDILQTRIREHLREKHIQDHHPVYDILKLDLEVCSMGLIDYLTKNSHLQRS